MTAAELRRQHPAPPVTCLGDLPPWERVWTRGPGFGEPAHRRAGRERVAVCGAPLSEWPTYPEDVAALGGGLCPGCWPTETPAGDEPAGDKERTSE